MQARLAEKYAQDFIRSLPKEQYQPIRELGECSRESQLNQELRLLNIDEQDYIMKFECTKVSFGINNHVQLSTNKPTAPKKCTMYITKKEIVTKRIG